MDRTLISTKRKAPLRGVFYFGRRRQKRVCDNLTIVLIRPDERFSGAEVRLYAAKQLSGGSFEPGVPAVPASNANTGNLFRTDANGKQHAFNLNTRNMAPDTYQLRVDLGNHIRNTVMITPK